MRRRRPAISEFRETFCILLEVAPPLVQLVICEEVYLRLDVSGSVSRRLAFSVAGRLSQRRGHIHFYYRSAMSNHFRLF
jgi:hypothetical protein